MSVFPKKVIKNLEFIDCEFEDCLFIGAELVDCRFTNCRFKGCNPHRIRIQSTYVDPRSFVNMLDAKSHTNIGINLFEQLLRNYRESGELDFIPTAEFEYRKWKRLRVLHSEWKKLPLTQRWRKARVLLSLFFFELTAGYGWKIKRFFITSIVIFICVYAVNMLLWDRMNINASDAVLQDKDPLTVLYFSVMLMSTLGFNSINPQSGLGMVLVSLEALLGPIWVSILAAMIIKKAIR